MRTERDFIGEVQLPDEVYYGVQTLRALHNFSITGHTLDKEFIVSLAIIKKAAANANMQTGRMPFNIGSAIVEAATEIIEGSWHDQFVVDCIQGGAGTSMNMNANEVIANRAIEILGSSKGDYALVSPNDHVNMAQSTNDVIPTAIRITTVKKMSRLVNELMALTTSLSGKSKAFSTILKMGRTHLQDAVPITLGQEFGAYAAAVKRAAQRIRRAADNLYSLNMGATAVGTGLNAEPEYIEQVIRQLCLMTNEKFISAANLVDATQNTDDLAEFASAMTVCALSLSKISNDLRLMASGPKCGFNEIFLPAMQPGSSIMPGKVNPVIPEMMNQVAFQIVGNSHTINLAVEAGQFELNVMEPVIAYNLFNSLNILTNAVSTFNQRCISQIEANASRCKQLVDDSIGIITALLPHLGYEQASLIAKEALHTGESVKALIVARGLIPAEHLEVILSPLEMTKPGIAGKQYIKKTPSPQLTHAI